MSTLRSILNDGFVHLTSRRAVVPALGILTLLTFTPAAPAQSTSSTPFKEERFEVSPYVGGTFYHGVNAGLGTHLAPGPVFGIHLTENFWQHFGFEESVGYNRNRMDLLTPIPNHTQIDQRFEDRAFNFNIDAVYYFTRLGSRVRPFLDAGAGGVRFRPTKEAVAFFQQNFSAPTGSVLRGETRGQYNYGGGVKLRLTDWIGVRGDVRGLISRNPTLGMSPLPSAGAYIPNGDWVKGAEVTAGLVFEIGKSKVVENKITVTPIVATPSQGDAGLTAANPAAPGTGFRLTESAHDMLGHMPLHYRWTANGTPIGEDSSTIMYTPAQPGQYKIEVQVSDTAPKNAAPSASPDPLTLYIAEHRITISAITIAPLQGTAGLTAANPAADGSGFRFSATATDTLGHPLTYRWTVDGAAIPGNSNSVTFTEAQPGTHSVGVQATDGTLTATAAAASFYTRDQSAPTATCNAAPDAVGVGQQVTLTVTPRVAQGSMARVRWTVSEGTVASATTAQTTFDSTSVSFPTSGQVQTKSITATATVTDDFGGTVSCTSTIRVSSNPQTLHYGDIVFGQGSARINNCAKRVLIDRIYPQLTGDYRGYTLVLVGHIDPSEASKTLDRRRVLNAAAVLSAGKDTCTALEPSRITADWVGTTTTEFKDTPCSVSFEAAPAERPADRVNPNDARAQNRRVEIWLVPPGKSLPASVKEAHTLPMPELQRLACPK